MNNLINHTRNTYLRCTLQKLKSIDYKILAGLMKNSKVSDRRLAKEIGVSQPTVTRRRAKLEQEALDGYTAIPKWAKMGYGILAFTFVKTKQDLWLKENYDVVRERGTKWLMNHPNIIMSGGCRGMKLNGFMISVHKSYSDFDEFMSEHNMELGDMFTEVENVIVNFEGADILKPFHMKYLAKALTS
jgi:DNA-binding Lrp family transcriptional regulator